MNTSAGDEVPIDRSKPHPAEANNFDVIHAHIDWLHLPLLSRLGVPFLTTCHGRLDLPLFPDVIRRFPIAPFVSISENQRIPLPEANWIGTIYHGLPQGLFRPSFEPGSYLAFLGRLTAEKLEERFARLVFRQCAGNRERQHGWIEGNFAEVSMGDLAQKNGQGAAI